MFEQEDLYKFNQLIHKLDEFGDHRAANDMRQIRREWFDEEGEPIQK